jgi:hypothetical protein
MPDLRVKARWYSPKNLAKYVEVYKCVVLTAIALLLAAIWIKTPTPFTFANLKSKRVSMDQMPLVRVDSGSVDVDNKVKVDVDDWSVIDPIEVQIRR